MEGETKRKARVKRTIKRRKLKKERERKTGREEERKDWSGGGANP